MDRITDYGSVDEGSTPSGCTKLIKMLRNMKTFSELVRNYTFEKFLNEKFITHICLETNDSFLITEKYGIIDDINELSFVVFNQLKSEFNQKENGSFILKKKRIKKLFIEELKIVWKKSNINEANYKFNNEISTIELQINNINKIRSIIVHELHHLYDDLILISKGFEGFSKRYSSLSQYGNLYLNSKQFNVHNISFSTREFRNAVYMLDDYETNAFISQLCLEIEEIKKRNNLSNIRQNKLSSQEIYNIIKETEIYKAFVNIGNFLDKWKNNKLDKFDTKFIQQDLNDNNIDKICKKLEHKYIKTLNKLSSIIPKKIAESFEYEITL